ASGAKQPNGTWGIEQTLRQRIWRQVTHIFNVEADVAECAKSAHRQTALARCGAKHENASGERRGLHRRLRPPSGQVAKVALARMALVQYAAGKSPPDSLGSGALAEGAVSGGKSSSTWDAVGTDGDGASGRSGESQSSAGSTVGTSAGITSR